MGRAWKQESGHQSSSTCFAPTCCGILSKSCPILDLYPPVKHNCHLELDTYNSASSSSFSGSVFFKPYTIFKSTIFLYPHRWYPSGLIWIQDLIPWLHKESFSSWTCIARKQVHAHSHFEAMAYLSSRVSGSAPSPQRTAAEVRSQNPEFSPGSEQIRSSPWYSAWPCSSGSCVR